MHGPTTLRLGQPRRATPRRRGSPIAVAGHRGTRQGAQARARLQPGEDPRCLPVIERLVLLGVVTLRDEVPPDLLAAVLEIAAQSLHRGMRRVAISDQEIHGQPARRAAIVHRRLTAAVKHHRGEPGRPARRVHPEVRRATRPANQVDPPLVDRELVDDGIDLRMHPLRRAAPPVPAAVGAAALARALQSQHRPAARQRDITPARRRIDGRLAIAVQHHEQRPRAAPARQLQRAAATRCAHRRGSVARCRPACSGDQRDCHD